MRWNWEHPDWPQFVYDGDVLAHRERRFTLRSGEFIGAFRHIAADDRESLRIDLISDEAVKTSAIEGEFLDRESVQSSLRVQFGLGVDKRRVPPAERGVAEMMVDLYRTHAEPLTEATLFAWHAMLMSGQRGLHVVGGYRVHDEPMQVVSGPIHRPIVHFEAPASSAMPRELAAFIKWFNDTAAAGRRPLPPLTRAGLAHLYFVSIHPFEDGNGRIARAIAEKALAQSLGQPSLIVLAFTIERKRKAYYAALERDNKDIKVDNWLAYFADTVLEAQDTTVQRLEFYIAKAKFYERYRDQLNPRQAKIIARMFREGIDGFKGGLSAENYIRIADTSRATATRDLQNLVAIGALGKTGELRHTRYHLALDLEAPVERIGRPSR